MICCCCCGCSTVFSLFTAFFSLLFSFALLRSHNERPFIFREFARFHRICLDFPLFNAEKSDYFFVSRIFNDIKKCTDKGCCNSHTNALCTHTHSLAFSSLIYFQHTQIVGNSFVAKALGMWTFNGTHLDDVDDDSGALCANLFLQFNRSIDSYTIVPCNQRRKKSREQKEEEDEKSHALKC